MKLVVGGFAQGKTAFVCDTFGISMDQVADGSNDEFATLCERKVIQKYHLFLKEALKEGQDITALTKRLLEKNPEVILIADEIGCGLVPMDAFERTYREEVGHLLCEVAKQAENVYRVYCGIGSVIK